MDCVEAAALKASFRAEMLAFRSWAQDQPSNDDNDEWSGSGVLTPGGDEFFVDGLLDFSNKDVVGGFLQEEDEDEEEEEKDCSIPGSTPRDDSYSSVLLNDDLEAGIDVPMDDLAALEWLSHFVEDSFTEFPSPNDSFPNDTAAATTNSSPSREQANHDPTAAPFAVGIQVPAKARSKRSRPGARVWSFCTPQSTESSTSSSSSFSSSTSSATESLDFSSSSLGKPPQKKKKKPAVPVKDQTQRRCSHCLVEKTPQWRTGPLGSKTLCNACGVRYKSGRLLPEYRPAGSPTFLSHVHSNHHRKVLEMRRTRTEDGPGLVAAVESF